MGSSLSCLCPSEDTGALLIKPNGKIIRIRAGTRVKDIRAFNPYHVVVSQSGGSSSVLSDSFQLRSEKAYALVLEGMHESFDLKTLMNLMKAGDQRGPRRPRAKVGADDHDKSSGGDHAGAVQVLLLQDASSEHRRSSSWKPALHTIPEVHSPDNF